MLRKRGDSAVEFNNAAGRLYVLHFIEVAEMGNHRVFYFMLRLADGKRGGAPDKEVVCYCHADGDQNYAIDRIFHLWARTNKDVIDGRVTSFDGAGHHAEGWGLHFTVMHHLQCKDIAELKTYILENSDAFATSVRELATSVREQIILLHSIEEKMHESDDAVC